MQWSSGRRIAVLFFSVLIVLSLQQPSRSAEDKKLSVYSSQGTYTLPVTDRDNFEYVSVVELLQPLAKVQSKTANGDFRIRAGSVEGQFSEGKTRVTVGKTEILLPAKVVIDQGRVLLPLRVLPTVLSKYLALRSELHEQGRRLFLENSAVRFSTDFKKSDLVLSFPTAVNPTVNTENGKVHLLFTHEPVVFGAESITYNDRLVSGISFTEHNGTAELVISGTSPLLASFGDGGKTITLSAAPAPVSVGAQSQTNPTPGNPPASNPGVSASATAPNISKPASTNTNIVRFFVMIDAGHGGDEVGVRFSEKLAEKDIALAMARKLKVELQNRGVAAVLLRDSDTTMSLDQRAVTSNAQRAGIYISVHAGVPGPGVRVFTALLPTPDKKQQDKLGPFLPWETAQAGYLERSRVLAANFVSEMGDKKVTASTISAPIAPLNSIAAPAIAIEIAPPTIDSKADALSANAYHQAIAIAMATAIVNVRPKIEEPR
ncbi:MAG: cell wall hydrolase/autolysin [Acidobacteriales bacterium]|nr:cell wall hydrolase/autolysin [Terriglobales bacterium]